MNNTFFKSAISLVVFALTIVSVPTYTYSWPGVYFEAAFVGTEVDLKLNDSNNILNIIVDGQAPIVLTKPGKTTYSINNLPQGKHHIRRKNRSVV